MSRLLKDNGGFALIITLLIISVIVTLSLDLNSSMRTDLQAAANFRESIRLDCIVRSGFNYAAAILIEDNADVDSLREPWADSKDISSTSASMFELGRLELGLTDLSGKIQINSIMDEDGDINENQKAFLKTFLSLKQFGLDPEKVEYIMDALTDWMDKYDDDEVTGFGGAENPYYQSIARPYSCRNGRLHSIEELLLVKGITKEIFYGKEKQKGISEYLTVYGDGKININTADPLILEALAGYVCESEDMAKDWIDYREKENSDLSEFNNYPGLLQFDDYGLLCTTSFYFEIESKGFMDNMSKELKCIVKRDDETVEIQSWKIE